MSKRGSNVFFACSFYTCILNNQVYIQAYLFLNDKDAFNEKKIENIFKQEFQTIIRKLVKPCCKDRKLNLFSFSLSSFQPNP